MYLTIHASVFLSTWSRYFAARLHVNDYHARLYLVLLSCAVHIFGWTIITHQIITTHWWFLYVGLNSIIIHGFSYLVCWSWFCSVLSDCYTSIRLIFNPIEMGGSDESHDTEYPVIIVIGCVFGCYIMVRQTRMLWFEYISHRPLIVKRHNVGFKRNGGWSVCGGAQNRGQKQRDFSNTGTKSLKMRSNWKPGNLGEVSISLADESSYSILTLADHELRTGTVITGTVSWIYAGTKLFSRSYWKVPVK